MWEQPFEVSMLSEPKIIIHCPDRNLVYDLMRVLHDYTNHEDLDYWWGFYEDNTCFFVENGALSYADLEFAERTDQEFFDFSDHIKCTFYGERANEADELNQINEDEWAALIEIVR